MKLTSFKFTLPKEQIALYPSKDRDGSRLTVDFCEIAEHPRLRPEKRCGDLTFGDSTFFGCALEDCELVDHRNDLRFITGPCGADVDGHCWARFTVGRPGPRGWS